MTATLTGDRIVRGIDSLTAPPPIEITDLSAPPTHGEVREFEESGVGIARSLLSDEEVAEVRDVFQAAGDKGPIEGLVDPDMLDPTKAGRDAMLRRFPRMLHPHRHPDRAFGRLALRWMLSDRIADVLRGLMSEEPVAAQSMYYFKGPGARGQSLHQDNLFLAVRPGTCLAAWVAVDDCDAENGAMVVVPGTGGWRLICDGFAEGDPEEFWGGGSLALPEGCEPQPADMRAGDVLFFNGSLVHGSYRNKSADRWRRSLIFHYAPASCGEIARFYHPLLAMDGSVVGRDESPTGGPCGGGGTMA